MRIVHLINNLATGGAERLVVELSKEMTNLGHVVSIVQLTHSPDNSPPATAAKDAGLEIVILGRHRFDPRSIYRVRRQTRDADIVHAHLFPAFYLAALLGRQPKVLTEHCPVNRRRQSPFMRLLDRKAYRRFDCSAAISDSVNRSLGAYLTSLDVILRCATIHNGIRIEDFSTWGPLARNGPLKLISVGTLNANKNVTESIAAVNGIADVTLTVVGDGGLRNSLLAQVDANHQRQQVTFLGTRSDVPALLRQHHVLIVTSNYEGFGLVAVEAMAAHVPVLAPDIPGVGEVVVHGDAGLLHRPHDVDQLRGGIVRLRDDDEYRKTLAINAHLRSRVFDIESCAKSYMTLYERALSNRSDVDEIADQNEARSSCVDSYRKESLDDGN